MSPIRKANAARITKEEASAILENVQARYGICPRTEEKRRLLAVQQGGIKGRPQHRERIRPASESVVITDGSQPLAAVVSAPVMSKKGRLLRSLQIREPYYYLIRLAECSVPLLCQIEAYTASDARNQLERFGNLTAWRELSLEEMAQIWAQDNRSTDE